ncbi:hypothetical protein CI109_107169 [Kwoniella shandongensis]|uniref:Dihydrolipoamide acetyltransferase component of pyruvate dehydrogenase complex n=1 Tax=Kwoniella shandongensis TaxID=1734106 RepID=A0A5M6C2Z7_9TREE|nr:uncharacterized protein CI109_002452 [Kwoniella shandongensis]KAA5529111.1 hypothetical protein CI109_002452 [Kwoniella shandongensis]
MLRFTPLRLVRCRPSRSSSALLASTRLSTTRRLPSSSLKLGSTLKQPSRSFHTSFNPFAPSISPFKLHDIGEGITEVEILKWYVEEGQEVQEFDALCEVQSDKSVVELTSHATGVVQGIKAETGKMVKVGQVLCEIRIDDGAEAVEEIHEEETQIGEEEPSTTSTGEAALRAQESAEVSRAEEVTERLEKAEEVVQSPSTSSSSQPQQPQDDRPSHLLQGKDESMDLSGPSRLIGEAAILPSPPRSKSQTFAETVEQRRASDYNSRMVVKASPAVRTLAARLDVDLASVEGTGDGGRVTKDDVERAAGSTTIEAAGRSWSVSSGRKREEQDEVTRVEFGRTRKVMWRMLGEQAKIPHFGYTHTLNLTPLLPYLKASSRTSTARGGKSSYLAADIPQELVRDAPAETPHVRLGLLSFLVKAMVLALEEHPIMRARVKESGEERWLEIARDGVIGVAVSDPKFGLLTPSLPALPPSTSLGTITTHLQALRQSPTKPTTPAHLTISSVGGLGEARGAMPVIPPGGGLAICAVGRAKWETEWALDGEKSVWDLDESEVKAAGTRAVLRAPVGWSADHRVLEGAELIAFTETWKRYIEEPWRWIRLDR